MEEIFAKLIIYGPLGVICAILLYAVVKLYKKNEELNKAYIEKAEFWTDQYHDLLKETNALVDRLIQKRMR